MTRDRRRWHGKPIALTARAPPWARRSLRNASSLSHVRSPPGIRTVLDIRCLRDIRCLHDARSFLNAGSMRHAGSRLRSGGRRNLLPGLTLQLEKIPRLGGVWVWDGVWIVGDLLVWGDLWVVGSVFYMARRQRSRGDGGHRLAGACLICDGGLAAIGLLSGPISQRIMTACSIRVGGWLCRGRVSLGDRFATAGGPASFSLLASCLALRCGPVTATLIGGRHGLAGPR